MSGTPNPHGTLAIQQLAVRRRWALSDEVKDELIAEMRELLQTGSPRDRTRAAEILAGLERMNQADELAETYALPVGHEGTTRILSPAETAALMDASVPNTEYKSEPVVHEVWPNPPLSSCSPLALLAADEKGTGAPSV